MMPNAAGKRRWVSGAPEARADDLHEAFMDDDVTVVLAAIGGNHSNQVVPHLDYDVIRSHPKVFQGFSDMTVLHWAFLKHAGLRTFYGPAFTLNLAEYPGVLSYTDKWLREAWFGDRALKFEPAAEWTEEFLDFDKKIDLTRPRRLRPTTGWTTVRSGRAEGPLLGGCLETIGARLKGSPEWLELDGAVLFLETSEESHGPGDADAFLSDLERLGVFRQVSGLVMGRPYAYSAEDHEVLKEVVAVRTAESGIPVLADFDAGHTDPMLTLPLGAEVVLDAGECTLRTQAPVTAQAA
jgi:muramoyltetrapeptide carboxypeptidase LdcA involved in peptidoglycan recycling